MTDEQRLSKLEQRLKMLEAAAQLLQENERLREQKAELLAALKSITIRLGEGHLQDGFGDDSRAAWVQRLTAITDKANATK